MPIDPIGCNSYKGTQTEAVDPDAGDLVSLHANSAGRSTSPGPMAAGVASAGVAVPESLNPILYIIYIMRNLTQWPIRRQGAC